MKIKKPSVGGMKNVSYLGRFQKDKFIQDGHNTTPKSESYMDIPMAYDVSAKRKREQSEWEKKGRPAAMKAKKEQEKYAQELERNYGKAADFREAIRAGIKRQKRY
jgi:hypothetical protein